jgi:predicted MFS family arabinose efflux permease
MLQQTDQRQTPAQHHLLTYLLLAFIAMNGLSYVNFLPGMVNALAGGIGFSEAEAGQIVALNGYGGLFGSAIAIFLVRRIRWQPMLLVCLPALAAMDIATAWLDSIGEMLSWRFGAGAIGGLAFGLVVAQLAKLANPDRAFGALLFLQFSLGSLVMVLLPALEAQLGPYAVFWVMAVLSILSLLMLLGLPASPNHQTKLTVAAVKPLPSQDFRHAILLLLAIAAYQLAASAIWAYVGLIGLGAAISNDNVNSYIAATGLLGLLGALLPMVTGQRYGRLPWLLAGTTLSATAAVLLNFATQHWLYLLAMTLLFFAWPAIQAYLFAVSAAFDGSGRLSTIATLVASIGLATGPLMASHLLEPDNFSKLLYSCAVIFLLSYLLLLRPVQAQGKPALPKPRYSHNAPDHSTK